MKREEKERFVSWMSEELEKAPSVVLADYRGLNVAQVTDLRTRCREAGVQFRVVKNTLMRMAAKDTPMEGVLDFLTGPSAMAWHPEHPGAAARVLAEFAKEKGNEALEFKGAAITGRAMSADEVKNVLATMPSREELLARMAGLIKAGPQKLHGAIAAGPAKLGRAMAALKQKKQEAA